MTPQPVRFTLRAIDRVKDYAWFFGNTAKSLRWRSLVGPLATPKATVVLLPGVFEDAGYFWTIRAALGEAGYEVRVNKAIKRSTKRVTALADIVADDVSKISGPVILLSHSKGSLIGRSVLCRTPENVLGLIALAGPWHGSTMARMFPSWSIVGRLRPGGVDVTGTWTPEANEAACKRIVSISPSWDPHIPEGSVLAGAINETVPTTGHFRLLSDPLTIELILKHAERMTAEAEAEGIADAEGQAGAGAEGDTAAK